MVDQHCHLGTSPCPLVLGKKGGRPWHDIDVCLQYLLAPLSYLTPPMRCTRPRTFCTPTLPQAALLLALSPSLYLVCP
jgi:hypothetical protein